MNIDKVKERAQLYIESCPEKNQNKATISKTFKQDLAEYLINRGANDNFLELGSSYGHTTQLLSIVCKHVVTVDNDNYLIKSINDMGYQNVTALCYDLYDEIRFMQLVDEHVPFQVSLIDAVHTYAHSLSDATKSIALQCDVLVFDDIGLFDGVNNAFQRVVSEASQLGIEFNCIPVGNPAGSHAHGEKVFKRSEGMILELFDLSLDDHSLRQQLMQQLLRQEDSMSDASWQIVIDKIDGIVDEKLSQVEEKIMQSGNDDLIHSFENDLEAVETTRKGFRDTIINEILDILGKDPKQLPDLALPDVLAAIQAADEEFQVVSAKY